MTVEQVFADCYKYYPDLFRTRVNVIEHLFFVIGNGYRWVDGGLVETNPEPLARIEYQLDADDDGVRPLPDDGEPRCFYPVSRDYSAVCTVPDDVKPDWLVLAYAAAIMLRDRSGISNGYRSGRTTAGLQHDKNTNASNIQIAIDVVSELERRFPQLV
jgi:hypothetical protein